MRKHQYPNTPLGEPVRPFKDTTSVFSIVKEHYMTPTTPTVAQMKLAREIVRKHYPEMPDDYSGRRVSIALDAIQATEARAQGLVDALAEFTECARYDPHMDGSSTFMGWNQSALRRAETRARQALATWRRT